MELFPLLSLALVTAALFSYLNHRFIKLPTTIGVMVIALAMSAVLIALAAWTPIDLSHDVKAMLERLDLQHLLLDVMLAFLLFAGALHVKLDDLLAQKWVIAILATVGVFVTTLLVGGLTYVACRRLGVEMSFLHCLLFGALISPTDPIAVMGILKTAGAPKSLETKIAGESLFNDGIGVVVFAVLLTIAEEASRTGAATVELGFVTELFAVEVLGSAFLGIGGGWIGYRLLKSVDNYQVEVLITLALATGLYSLAASLHSSGPLAVVVAGLFIGNTGRTLAMSPVTARHVDTFWELVDEILNVLLFVILGMEIVILKFVPGDVGAFVMAGLVAIPLVLLSRFLSVGATVTALRVRRRFTPHAVKIMTWGGLRGAISVALALSIPEQIAPRHQILTMTYVVVVFSIVVQGLTVGRLVRKIPPGSDPAPG